jgi:transcriptional regulator with XRE-family HTH domain
MVSAGVCGVDSATVSIFDVRSIYGRHGIATEKTEYLQAFAARLKATIGRRKTTLEKVAKHLGISTSTVGAWTQGKNFPEVQLQPTLAAFLGEPVEWLIHGIGKTDYPEVTERVESGVQEEPFAYGGPRSPNVEAAIRSYCEELIAQASGDPTRLGWVIEQLRTHLRPPPHWAAATTASSSPKKLTQLERIHLDDIARRAAQKDFREQHGVTPAPGEKASPTGEAAASSS